MFSSIGWGEIFFILIIGLIVIGPERLPSVIEDVRAAIYAARKAINNAKRELNGELEEFEELRKPLDTVSQYASMGPKRAMAKLFFEDDEEFLESFDPRKMMEDDRPAAPQPSQSPQPSSKKGPEDGGQPSGGGFSWADVT
ncbi:twin arginine-targeting protein translocase TatB [Corynebacterium sp. NML140438]|uniref:Sec-independent protein translocase protein TatB n=1 Tax=Corynebacterium sp. NML140438 TaxID=1906334 RepID=UPI0008FB19AE|nr:Sec-independent protein translocase protein TatB [Corynebacterium sp. NML140438]OIR41608.1 twin arginine-targeting protein translocase TatB [Corynebacterium sp. NML140438]